ncbi:MAG: cyclase family protein [Luteitalea sp.]|nr:cyclase family protein [Luteitalea sp.]
MHRIAAMSLVIVGAFVVLPVAVLSGQNPASSPFKVHPSTQEPGRLVTLSKLQQWEKELSNWGRWGKDDERGLLNLITPEKTKQALGLVKEGTTVTLQINPIKKTGSDTGGFGENVHRMWRIEPDTGEVRSAIDVIQLSLHDGLNSHLDALCHYQGPVGRKPGEPTVAYNGVPFNLTAAGCQKSAADRMGPGYITRGVLVDMPLMKKVKWLESSTPIYVEDLEAWEKFAGIRIGAGDALLIRGGRWAKRAADGPWAYGQGGAGLHASVLPWLRARDVSLLASDAVNDVQPSGVQGIGRPVHQLTQVNMGLPIVDNAYLEDAAGEAERLKRWEFMFTLHIFQIKGGTAAPFNALATF